MFHAVSWSSHKSHRSVRYTGTAGKVIETGKTIAQVYRLHLQLHVDLVIIVGLEDLCTMAIAERPSISKSIRGDVGIIRFAFEIGNIAKVIFIPGELNTADLGTEFHSPISSLVVEMLSFLRIPFDASNSDSFLSDRFFG